MLGEDFIDDVDHYRVNTNIYFCFMASLLDLGMNEDLVVELTQTLFPQEYFGGLEEVVRTTVPFLGLLYALDLRRFVDHNQEVEWFSLISGLRTMTLSEHHFRVERVTNFLLCIHFIVPTPIKTTWYTDFRDYIFPRILTLDIRSCLVHFTVFQEFDNDFGFELMKEADDSDKDPDHMIEEGEEDEDD